MQKSVKKRKRDYADLFSKIENADSRFRDQKSAQRLASDKQNMVNNRQDKNIEDPKWKKTILAKTTELESLIKTLSMQQTDLRLKLTKINTANVQLDAKVTTMFTPLEDTFAYKNIMFQLADLEETDNEARIHCSTQRSNRAITQAKETSALRAETKIATNMALELKEILAVQAHQHRHPDNVPSHDTSTANSSVQHLSTDIAKLTADLEHLTHRVHKLDKVKAPRSHAVSTSTTRSGTSGRASRKSRISNLTMSSARRDTIVHEVKREKRDTSPHDSSSDPYSQSWETPRNTRPPKSRHAPRSDRHPPALYDYQATSLTLDELLSWNESGFSTNERPSVRYCGRIHKVPVAMKEHNQQYQPYTTEWKQYRADTLRGMEHNLPKRLTPAQVMTHSNLTTYLLTTSHLELGYSLARHNNTTTPQDIWPVTCPLCDPASHLQGDISHFDRHLPPTLKNIRNCPGHKIRKDGVTHGQSHLQNSENMLNAQDLYDHIRLYADTCFLHAALEHILNRLYPDVQRQMTNERDITRIIYPPVTFN